ncbi:probable protein phosphatase 2C 55 [Argentina anserina]|uniref:probable protein phosphatase 2C 55 n=1 Tax=Argentina anserina TaxID=57926 RepID=UPI0021762E36|nr:probable protein phosphatase 2C 55 [Potentilla anserina]
MEVMGGGGEQPCQAEDLSTSFSIKKPRVESINPVDLSDGEPTRPEYVVLKERTTMKMVCGSFYLSKERRDLPIEGDDAHFICAEENIIGVADGVGGTRKKGIDSGVYARKLMNNAVKAVHNQPRISGDSNGVDLRKVLNEAYANTKDVDGSSTACIVALNNKDGKLHAVNVGDSGFMLFRNKKCIYKSEIQIRSFNCPVKLGRKAKNGPQSAVEINPIEVIPGDVIVLGTDGLLDNVWPEEIEQVLEENTIEGYVEPEHLAWTIAEQLALRNSEDVNRFSPFCFASLKVGKERIGGKVDDITVVVGHIIAT